MEAEPSTPQLDNGPRIGAMIAHGLVVLWLSLLQAQVPEAPPPQIIGDGSPEAHVRFLYEQHQPWRKKGLDLTSRKVLGKLLLPQLVYGFLKEEECKRRTKEICRLDFDPFIGGQDYPDGGITDLKMTRLGPPKPCNEPIPDVRVARPGPILPCELEVTFKSLSPVRLVFQLGQTPSSWRVQDIQYPD